VPQERILKALSHHARIKILSVLTERTASPKELSEELEMPLGNVSYHVRVLVELNLIDLVEEERIKGSIAHFYTVTDGTFTDNPAWQSICPKFRTAVLSQIREVMSDSACSLGAGVIDQREGRHLSRTPLLLDENGWKRVSEILREAAQKVVEEETAAAERLSGVSGARKIHAVLGMFYFEVLPDPHK